ncbi:MAG TPA: serine/threonine-protein kinase [Pseudonocardiaceae bacterium]|nr:serine/threonine-protein kinase [Pseudonocardiaceae bacterium]
MSDDLTGRRLGHYQVERVIGKGGMSVLYRATDVRLGRKVALKVMAQRLGGDPEFRERFADEARNTSAIDHSHVVPLYDFGETDGLLYIAMRYVEGPDLASLIKDGPLAPNRALALLSQVADALDSVHSRGLVHLDVKPANVLVTTRESAGVEHAYLADFGLTRRGATGHRTASGDFLGSPTYAAPEHLRGEPVDPRTDQYALACVLFACLTGRAPFRGTVSEVIQGHLGGEVPAASALVALPRAVDEVVRRGMSRDPAGRYGSCRELVAAARGALIGWPRQGGVATPRPPAVTSEPPGARPGAPPAPAANRPPPAAAPPGPGVGHRPPVLPPPGQPIRLRDPLPAQPASFASGARLNRWIIPAALAVAGLLVLLVLGLALSLGGGDSGERPASPTPGVDSGNRGDPSRISPR